MTFSTNIVALISCVRVFNYPEKTAEVNLMENVVIKFGFQYGTRSAQDLTVVGLVFHAFYL